MEEIKSTPNIKMPRLLKTCLITILSVIFIFIAYLVIDYIIASSKPIPVDVVVTDNTMRVEYLINLYGLDFDAVTTGANCMSGTQTKHFNTELYGELTTEFSYCSGGNDDDTDSVYLHIYNSK